MNTTRTTHKSGLKLISHLMPDVPAVTFNIFVHTGSRFEDAENAGVAHFFEHMVFKGTQKRPSPIQVMYELESIGAEVNAFTSQEYTCYYLKVLRENLDQGVDILTDAFVHSLLVEEEMDKERNVIKEEKKMYEDDPSSFADDMMLENLYPTDRYGRDIIGSYKTLDAINSNVMKDFIKKHYNYENTSIVVAGNVTHEQVEALVDKYFDFDSYTHGVHDPITYTQQKFEQAEYIFEREIQQTQLRLSTYGVPFMHEDMYRYIISMAILGDGFGSKLSNEVREKRGLAYSIYGYSSHWSRAGHITIGAGLQRDKVDEVKQITKDEIHKLAEGDFTPEDLQRAKEVYKAGILMNMDTTNSWVWYLGLRDCIYNDKTDIKDIIHMIDEVNHEDVVRIMKKLESAEWMTTLVVPKAG